MVDYGTVYAFCKGRMHVWNSALIRNSSTKAESVYLFSEITIIML